jgi:ribose-phosphate pyrophosphokinase
MGKDLELAIYDISPVGEGHTFEDSPNTKFSRNVLAILGKEAKFYPSPIVPFNDGGCEPDIKDSVRGKKIFVFQSHVGSVLERVGETVLFTDAVIYGGNRNGIVAVWPHCFGSRGDRRDGPRKTCHSLVFANMLAPNDKKGIETLLTGGIHSDGVGAIYNGQSIQFECLEFEAIAANYILRTYEKSGTVALVGPDAGSGKRLNKVEKIVNEAKGNEGIGLNVLTYTADKIRTSPTANKTSSLLGDVGNLDIMLLDDIGNTMGSIRDAAENCRKGGAKSVRALLYHGTLGEGYEKKMSELLDADLVDELVIGNTIPLKKYAKEHPKVRILPFEPLFAEAIRRIYDDRPMSELFTYNGAMEIYDKARHLFKGDPKYIKIGHIKLPTLDS